jgi:hypothetical protein
VAGRDGPDEGALSGAGDVGDGGEDAERDVDVDVAEVVLLAPRICSAPVGLRTAGLRVVRSSRWRPVTVPEARSFSRVPSKQMVPPALPAPGPRSMTWLAMAMAMVSGLCSTTGTVLPLSRSRSRRLFMRRMSWGCRPTVGSSKM